MTDPALHPVIPRYHKRAFAHNYHAPFIYHIILKKNSQCDSFGSVKGDARITPGSNGCAYIQETALGSTIAKAIINLPKIFQILQIYQYVVMPDHVHILLRVKEWSEKHLDFYIDYLTANISRNYSRIIGRCIRCEDIFQSGYCDKALLLNRSLDGLFRYIRENPHRLAMRKQFPQFFQRVRRLRIGDKECEAYGNLFLFRNPDKIAVKISRSFSAEEKLQKKDTWLMAASQGGVLVSPFISREEKGVREDAEARGAKIILITHEAFPERFKPGTHNFELCSAGLLLIISMGFAPKTELSRQMCLQMNALAELLASS